MNYKILSGPFEGEVVREGQILDVPFRDLDQDLQSRIREWADAWFRDGSDMDQVKDDYENNWDSEDTNEAVTLKPISEW